MNDVYWLTDGQLVRLERFFPKRHGKPRVDDQQALNCIVFVSRSGLRWRDAFKNNGLHKALYNRWKQ